MHDWFNFNSHTNTTQNRKTGFEFFTDKFGNIDNIGNFVLFFLQFTSLFVPTDASQLEIRNRGVNGDYISRLHALMD